MTRGHASSFLALFVTAAFNLHGCSNPFSSSSEHRTLPHTANVTCQSVQFDQERFDVSQLRALVSCLNTDGSLNEIHQWLQFVPDNELQALSSIVNRLLHEDVKSLFAIRSAHQKLTTSGNFKKIMGLITKVSAQPALNERISVALRRSAPSLTQFYFDPTFTLPVTSFEPLIESQAWQRLQSSIDFKDAELALSSTHRLVTHSKTHQLLALYRLFETKGVRLPQKIKDLEQLSRFFQSAVQSQHFQGFSKTLEKTAITPIPCFGGSKPYGPPLGQALKTLASHSPSETQKYLTSTLRALTMTARGYCEIPFSIEPLLKFTDPLLEHPGFLVTHGVLKPLLQDDRFALWLGSEPVRSWVADSRNWARDTDLLDIAGILFMLTQVSDLEFDRLLDHLDKLARSIDPKEIRDWAEFLSPLAQTSSVQLWIQSYRETPSILFSLNANERKALQALTTRLLSYPNLHRVITSAHELAQSGKLERVIHEIFQVFEQRIQTGQHPLSFSSTKRVSKLLSELSRALFKPSTAPQQTSSLQQCSKLNTDLPLLLNSTRRNWNELAACFGDHSAAQAWIRLSQMTESKLSQRQHLGVFLQAQEELISTAFRLDSHATTSFIHDFLRVPRSQITALAEGYKTSSSILRQTLLPALQSPGISSEWGTLFENPRFYRALFQITSHTAQSKSASPGFAARDLRSVDLKTSTEALMQTHCPSLDPNHPDCDVDADQVQLFKTNRNALEALIVSEYADSAQSWLHPKLSLPSQAAQPTVARPKVPHELGDPRTALFPLIRVTQQSPGLSKSFQQIFRPKFIDTQRLYQFLETHSQNYTLIPYLYQIPSRSLRTVGKEFHQRIRLRMVSDLDRLELIAINTDFKPLGMSANLGLNFIRQIALSWGDDLQDSPKGASKKTLAQTTQDIHDQLDRFDRKLLHDLGNCDPRGRGRLGRWLRSTFCSATLSDASARLFNLRSLVPLLDRMQTRERGGTDGLRVLRNLFYSLYQYNDSLQKDRFPNGHLLEARCLQDLSNLDSQCHFDQLTVISWITRLGLLHQVSVLFSEGASTEIKATLQLLSELSEVGEFEGSLQTFLRSPHSASQWISIEEWLHQPSSKAMFSANDLFRGFRWARQLAPSLWVAPLVKGLAHQSRWFEELKPLLVHQTDSKASRDWLAAFEATPDWRKSIETWSNQWSTSSRSELQVVMNQALSNLDQLSLNLRTVERQLEGVEFSWLLKGLSPLLDALSRDQQLQERQQIGEFFRSRRAAIYCDVFTDTSSSAAISNWVVGLHQNPDSLSFWNECRAFLFR